jgi:acyl carrier protein
MVIIIPGGYKIGHSVRIPWVDFIATLSAELNLPPSSLVGSAILKQGLGVDSFMKIHLACVFEDEYGIEVSEAGIVAALTVRQLYALVNR